MELPSDSPWHLRKCSYVGKNPLTYCFEPAQYLVVTQTEGRVRAPYELRYGRCGKHRPVSAREVASAGTPPEPGMIGTEEAAAIIGVSIWALHQWRRRHRGLSYVKVRGRYWYRRSEVQRFAEARSLTRQAIS